MESFKRLSGFVGSVISVPLAVAMLAVSLPASIFLIFTIAVNDESAIPHLAMKVAEKAGEVLAAQQPAPTRPVVAAVAAPETYTVESGDTVSLIAVEHGAKGRQVAAWVAAAIVLRDGNTVRNKNRIRPGDVVVIPAAAELVARFLTPAKKSAKQNASPGKAAKAASQEKQRKKPGAKTGTRTSARAVCLAKWDGARPARGETLEETALRIERNFGAVIRNAAAESGIDPRLIIAKLAVESRGDPCAVSPTGCSGISQFTKTSAKAYGLSPSERFDPLKSIPASTRLFRDYLDEVGGNERLALAAYNVGPGNVHWVVSTQWKRSKQVCEKTGRGRVCYPVNGPALREYIERILRLKTQIET